MPFEMSEEVTQWLLLKCVPNKDIMCLSNKRMNGDISTEKVLVTVDVLLDQGLTAADTFQESQSLSSSL